MKEMYKLSIFILIVLSGCQEKGTTDKKTEAAESITIQSKFEKIKLSELDGKPLDLAQYKGKTIFINFWAPWCGPCLEEMPSIQKAQEQLKNEDIVYLFVSDDPVEQLIKFKKDKPYAFHYIKADNTESLDIMALPTTYIFNKEGILVFSDQGYRKWDDQENLDVIINATK